MKSNELPDQLGAIVERVHRACLTVGTLPKDGPRGLYTTWPLFKLDWFDAEEFGAERMPSAVAERLIQPARFAASPREIDDCLPALALLDGYTPPPHIGGDVRLARRVIAFRAHQLWYGEHAKADERYSHYRGGWRGIGARFRCSATTARNIHFDAMTYALRKSLERNTHDKNRLSKIPR